MSNDMDDGKKPEKPRDNIVAFPTPKGKPLVEALKDALGDDVPLFPLPNLRQKKHRYMGMIVGFEQSASLCQEMERQDIEVFSVNAFPQPLSPGHIAMAAFVMGRVDKDRPPTDLEKTSEEESKRLIQPAVNRPDFNGNGRKK
jgi:hypothetical protein